MARLLAFVLLVFAALARPAPALALTQQEFNALLTGLGSAMFGTRESAEETLTGLATQHLLTADQIKSIQNLVVSTDLEVQQRAGRIFAAFVQTLPSYQAIMSLVGAQQTRAPTFNFDGSINQPGRYTFDEASGSYKSPQSITNRNLLETGWAMVNEALRVGNVAAATTALQNLRAAIAALPADAFNTSFLAPDNGGPRLNQNAVLGKIDDALNEMKAFMLDLQFFGAQNEPALPPPVGIAVAGVIPLGQSLSLSLASVPAPGSLLVTSSDTASGAPALPPPDYAFLGPIFDLEAEEGLTVSGEIGISIEYGSAVLPAFPLVSCPMCRSCGSPTARISCSRPPLPARTSSPPTISRWPMPWDPTSSENSASSSLSPNPPPGPCSSLPARCWSSRAALYAGPPTPAVRNPRRRNPPRRAARARRSLA
jgi:hypothetical protein